jgi:exodeoxyribonuclease V alpha subunit
MNDIPKAKDFAFCTLKGTEQIVSIFKRGLENLQSRKVESPLDQIVVLTPQNGEDYGTKNLNKLIQNVVLPETDQQVTHNGIEYRVGSKVMQTSNDNELGVANGEIGYVTKIDFEEKTVTIDFDGHEYEYDGDMLDNVQLGYAMTIHKSQGSEWKYVIEICSHTSRMNTRSLVYTGVTRTRERLIILGDLETFKNCPKNLGQTRRSYVIEPTQTI